MFSGSYLAYWPCRIPMGKSIFHSLCISIRLTGLMAYITLSLIDIYYIYKARLPDHSREFDLSSIQTHHHYNSIHLTNQHSVCHLHTSLKEQEDHQPDLKNITHFLVHKTSKLVNRDTQNTTTESIGVKISINTSYTGRPFAQRT